MNKQYAQTMLAFFIFMTGCLIAPNTTTGNIITKLESECIYTVTPGASSFASGGGTGSFNVDTQSGCGWTAVTVDLNNGGEADWIDITSGSSGTGSGAVSFSVAPNEMENNPGLISEAKKLFYDNKDAMYDYYFINGLHFSDSLISSVGWVEW